MKVLGSTILMTSMHNLDVVETRQESLRIWRDARTPVQAAPTSGTPSQPQNDQLSISEQAWQAYNEGACKASAAYVPTVDSEFFGLSPEDRLLILMLEKVLGIKVRLPQYATKAAKPKTSLAAEVQAAQVQAAAQSSAMQASNAPQRAGWGLSYDLNESYKESETMSFSAKGIVNTADGKQINIEVQLNMSRQFATQRNVSLRAGDAKIVDPIVINYSGPAADFTKTTFQFDLDTDGTTEAMPFLASGSGFLALDGNRDGVINSGAELFGPASGNGFTELRRFDSDGNGWLDAGDPVFDKLRIWTKDDQGKDVLFALGQKGVGAIYLGSIGADFSMKDEANRLQARNTRMGIYLSEGGQAGTVQQADLVVNKR